MWRHRLAAEVGAPVEITSDCLIRRVVDDEAERSAEEHHPSLPVWTERGSPGQRLQRLLDKGGRQLGKIEADDEPPLRATRKAAHRNRAGSGFLGPDHRMRLKACS